MYLTSLATAVPARRYTRAECWDAFATSAWFGRLDERSRTLARLVLTRDNGMESRWLAVDSLAEAFAIDADTLQRALCADMPRSLPPAPAAWLCNARPSGPQTSTPS